LAVFDKRSCSSSGARIVGHYACAFASLDYSAKERWKIQTKLDVT